MEFKKVTKIEFDTFIKLYPAQLEYDITGVCDPPLGTFNDFRDGKIWPESIVAKIFLNEFLEYNGETNDYYIAIEVDK